MPFNYLNYEQAHEYVNSKYNVFWDGWDIVSWRPNSSGFSRSDGMFRNGKWGTVRRIKPNRWGKWRVSG